MSCTGFRYRYRQRCGSGIRCLFDPWIRNGQKIRIRIRDKLPSHIYEGLKKQFFMLKYFNSLMRIRDLRSGMEKFGSGTGSTSRLRNTGYRSEYRLQPVLKLGDNRLSLQRMHTLAVGREQGKGQSPEKELFFSYFKFLIIREHRFFVLLTKSNTRLQKMTTVKKDTHPLHWLHILHLWTFSNNRLIVIFVSFAKMRYPKLLVSNLMYGYILLFVAEWWPLLTL